MPNKYPAYISWEQYEKIQAMLDDNRLEYTRERTRGVPREGSALLQGIVYCGESGHKMGVVYQQRTQYRCHELRSRYGRFGLLAHSGRTSGSPGRGGLLRGALTGPVEPL